MKEWVQTILLMLIVSNVMGQFNYYPPKPESVSEKEYRRGRLILENSYSQMKNAKNGVVAIDYFNIATAYSIMGQSNDTIFALLLKGYEVDRMGFCYLIKNIHKHYGGIENFTLYKKIGQPYKDLTTKCEREKFEENIAETPHVYAKNNHYDSSLVLELDRILKLDQKYRAINYNAVLQTPIDRQNILDIIKIIDRYGYPGKSLVGVRYDFVACAIIQRSNKMEYWDKYLPIISEAVSHGELSNINHLKMLIDRIYIDKMGVQIFGSKMNIPFADDNTILEVKRTYRIDGEIDIESYALEGGYDIELITELDRITRLDQKYRSPYNYAQQEPLDMQNIKDIEAIIGKYGYPGRKLVGEKYESTAWAVIQHADLTYQEKYLPFVHKAVQDNQLAEASLKMLIDRIYTKKTDRQIFGSQPGVDFVESKIIQEIKTKYNIK